VIAAERTGRGCYGIELDPLYVDTIIRRWQAYTGEHARHAASDRTFVELEYGVGQRGAGASQSAVWSVGLLRGNTPEEGYLGDSAGYYRRADAETAQKLLSFTVNDARAG
jgi:hypothetical protein